MDVWKTWFQNQLNIYEKIILPLTLETFSKRKIHALLFFVLLHKILHTWSLHFLTPSICLEMEYKCESYQLGHGGDLMFEKDLEQLVEHLWRPYPEFFGVPLNHQSGGQTQWVVTTDLRGKMGSPIWETTWFSVKGKGWKEVITKAM